MSKTTKLTERKTYFLTYAQTDADKQALLDYLKTLMPIDEYIVAKELHQDGNPHLHVYLKFSEKTRKKSINFFDYFGHHPNIATPNKAEGIARVKKYCMKGGDYLTNLDTLLTKREQMAKDLMDSGITKEFIRNNPSIMWTNFSSVKSWVTFFRGFEDIPVKNMPKKRHYWVYGPANCGKTRGYLNIMVQLYESQEIPMNNDWSGVDHQTELLYKDDFKGGITIQELNRITDGRTTLNTKGSSTRISYPLVVICSNYSIRGTYHNADDVELDALAKRFNEFDAGVRLPKWTEHARCEL